MSRSKVVSADTLLRSRIGVDRAVVDAAGEAAEPLALGAVAAHQLGLVGALQDRRSVRKPSLPSRAAATLPTP